LKRWKWRYNVKDTTKTRFRGFSVKKQGFLGLICKKPGLKHDYAYKPKVYSAKRQDWTFGGKTKKSRGLTVKIRTKLKDLWRWKGSFVIFKIAGAYVQDSS
jgi:hypothetical protein